MAGVSKQENVTTKRVMKMGHVGHYENKYRFLGKSDRLEVIVDSCGVLNSESLEYNFKISPLCV